MLNEKKPMGRFTKKPVVAQNNTKYRPGDVVSLKVVRLGEMGAFLDGGTGNTDDDILLHKLQQTAEVKEGDSVKVYLYLDPSKRLTASMKLPKMREGQLGYVRVISVTRDGGFVDIGAERGVFLPYSQMRGHVSEGQLVWVKLYRDKSGRQAVTMRVEEDPRGVVGSVKSRLLAWDERSIAVAVEWRFIDEDQPLNLVLQRDKSVRELVIRDGRYSDPEAAV